MTDFREVGGDFEWIEFDAEPRLQWPERCRWFARGRDAVSYVLQQDKLQGKEARVFVPDFFCESVIGTWIKQGYDVAYFSDSPIGSTPVFVDEHPDENDFILVVNYFGVSDRCQWAEKLRQKYGAKIIEDHTHDPVSKWALNSEADYCFASLRKSLPVTDGAILWTRESGIDVPLNEKTAVFLDTRQVAAMTLKRVYVDTGYSNAALKAVFRSLQLEHELGLESENDILHASPWSCAALANGYPTSWRTQRRSNATLLIGQLMEVAPARLLFDDWPSGQCPYCVVLKFENMQERDRCRSQLIDAGIYPPIHWQIKSQEFRAAMQLGQSVLSIPCDQRYGKNEMNIIADLLTRLLAA